MFPNLKNPVFTDADDLNEVARQLRRDIINMLLLSKSGHSGGPLGLADIFAQLRRYNFIDRAAYREKEGGEIASKIISEFPNYLVIPEGGSNQFALAGIQELYVEIKEQVPDYSHLVLSMGTGGTAGALLSYLKNARSQMVVYPALKGDWMEAEIINYAQFFNKSDSQIPNLLTVRSDYHFGGYGKIPSDLLVFIDEIKIKYDLSLDPIYTGKAFYGLMADIKNGMYKPGDILVFIHTGGLRK